MNTRPSLITFRLRCAALPPVPPEAGPVTVGIQDKDGQVHPGTTHPDGSVTFECRVAVAPDRATGEPVFHGPFAHGSPVERFLYLSWQRAPGANSLWFRRVKVRLPAMTWDLAGTTEALEADITGRRGGTEVVTWTPTRPADRESHPGPPVDSGV